MFLLRFSYFPPFVYFVYFVPFSGWAFVCVSSSVCTKCAYLAISAESFRNRVNVFKTIDQTINVEFDMVTRYHVTKAGSLKDQLRCDNQSMKIDQLACA